MTNEDPITLTGARLDEEPPAAERAGSGAQAEQASSVTAAEACECRKNISESLHWMKTCNVGAGTFKTGWDDAIDAALAFLGKRGDPCPCEQSVVGWQRTSDANRTAFREAAAQSERFRQAGVAALNERDSLRAELAAVRERFLAERDDARRLLDEAREALARIAGEIPHASASRSARRNIALAALTKIDAAQKPEA